MKFFLLSTLLAIALASLTSEPFPELELAARAGADCVVGQTYCGRYLIDQVGWPADLMRQRLCQRLGKCDFKNGDAWNSLWLCGALGIDAEPERVCGGEGSCAGPAAHCLERIAR